MDTPYNLIEEDGGTTTCTNTTVHQPEKMTPCIVRFIYIKKCVCELELFIYLYNHRIIDRFRNI